MIINSFSIIDVKNEEAQDFEFKSGTNLIVSKGNTQGKSSLLKSMYFTLGFDIRQFPSNWNIDDMYFQLNVSINNKVYTITRQKNIFRVNDINNNLNVKEYSDWLQDKLNIKLKLVNNRTKNLYDAYSSAVILPFYIDQDDSWDGGMYKNVTNTLNQYSDIPKDIFKGIFNLSSFEILDLQNSLRNSTKEMNEKKSTIENLLEVLQDYKSMNKEIPLVEKIDKTALKNDINRYLKIQNSFNEEIKEYKLKLLNKQGILDTQKQELSEIDKLLKMSKSRYNDIKAECRYCHSKLTTEQSLERLNLTNNYLEITILRNEIIKEIEKLNAEIKELRVHQKSIESEVDEIYIRIKESKELLTIDEYIKASAKNETVNELQILVDKHVLSKGSLEEAIKKLRKDINELKKEKGHLNETIKVEYDILIHELKKILKGVDMNELKFLEFKKITGSGMDKNKKYLAYYLAYFNLLRKYSTYHIPFCMDSFIRNEITDLSSQHMFAAVEKYFFDSNYQSFFSIVSENLKHLEDKDNYNNVEVNGKLLSKQKYKEIELKFVFDNQ